MLCHWLLAPWTLAGQNQHEWAGYEKLILELLRHSTHLESSIKELSTYSFFSLEDYIERESKQEMFAIWAGTWF